MAQQPGARRSIRLSVKKFLSDALDGIRVRMAILSNRINPIEDKNVKSMFRICKILAVTSVIGTAGCVFLMATEPDKDVFALIRHCGILLINGCMIYTNFRDMLKIKKKVRMQKVVDLVDIQHDEYEAMVIKLAAAEPELPPPDRAEYEQTKSDLKRVDDEITAMIAAAVASGHLFVSGRQQIQVPVSKPTGTV